jgi:hypothetical protein
MIITGDIAVPDEIHSLNLANMLGAHPNVFEEKTLVCNFEGLLSNEIVKSSEPILSNHTSVLGVLKGRGNVVACLANNHILDLPGNFDRTINAFIDQKIIHAGAGRSSKDAEKPVLFFEDGRQVIIYNACWDFLLYNHKNPLRGVYVSVIDEFKMINKVSDARKNYPSAAIIVFLHWNFDLENLPFPMHRTFSRELIDNGADLVVGTHSHCVQGGEKYNNGYIVYGLGNFYLPNGEFAMGNLKFPELSDKELVLEWNLKTDKIMCHWFEYARSNKAHQLEFHGSDDFEQSDRLKKFSPFNNMHDSEYLLYYRKNRRKKLLIPVFLDHRHKVRNGFSTAALKIRGRLAHLLARMRLIKWQN